MATSLFVFVGFMLYVKLAFAQSSTCNQLYSGDGVCWCNLNSGACDVHCCCDPDCNSTETGIFSYCVDQYSLSAACTCYPTDAFMFNRSSYAIPGSSCLFSNTSTNLNRAQNYFLDPSGYYMCTTTQIGNVINYNHKPGYLSGFVMPDVPSSPYQGGSNIVLLHSNTTAVGYLSVPRPLYNNLCVDANPARLFYPESWSCLRYIESAQSVCYSPQLQLSSYYSTELYFVKNPSSVPFWSIPNIDANQGILSGLSTSTIFSNSVGDNSSFAPLTYSSNSSCTQTIYSGNSCSCAVQSVNYAVNYTATGTKSVTITSIVVSVTFSSNWTRNSTFPFFMQSFSVSYIEIGTSYPSCTRSGKSGYQLGLPLLGYFAYENSTRANTCGACWSSYSVCSVQMLSSAASGYPTDCSLCSSNPSLCYSNVSFGRNARSGCTFAVTPASFSTVCAQLKSRNAQISLLTGITNTSSISNNILYYMATYGDQLNWSQSAVGNTWLIVPVVDATGESTWGSGAYTQASGWRKTGYTCTGAYLRVTLEVLYAKTGALPNPQAKLLSARYVLGAPETIVVDFDELTPFANVSNSSLRYIQLSSAVSFVDVSADQYAEKSNSSAATTPTSFTDWTNLFYLIYVDAWNTEAGGALALSPLPLTALIAIALMLSSALLAIS